MKSMIDPLRIAFISSAPEWGAGVRWMIQVAKGLRRRGHEAHLVCAEGSALEQRGSDLHLPLHTVRFGRNFDPLLSLRFRSFFGKKKVQIIVPNLGRELRVAGLAARFGGVRAVVPRRGEAYSNQELKENKYYYAKVAKKIFAESKVTRNALIDLAPWIQRQKIQLIYNGVRVEDYDFPYERHDKRRAIRSELGVPRGAFLLGTLGTLTKAKGNHLAIEALAALAKDFSNVRLLIAGDGPERKALEEQGEAAGVRDRVHFSGFRRDVPEILCALDTYLLLAASNGLGYGILEAMAAGLPVVAFQAKATSELVLDKHTGLLVVPDDAEALKSSIERLIRSPDQRQVMGEKGLERVRQKFSEEQMLDELETAFQETVYGSLTRRK